MEPYKTIEEYNVSGWEKLVIEEKMGCLLFWKLSVNEHTDGKSGFDFRCIAWPQCQGMEDGDHYETLFHGTACFDGMRHIWFGDSERDGYLYYPHMPTLVKALGELTRIESNECDEVSGRRYSFSLTY